MNLDKNASSTQNIPTKYPQVQSHHLPFAPPSPGTRENITGKARTHIVIHVGLPQLNKPSNQRLGKYGSNGANADEV